MNRFLVCLMCFLILSSQAWARDIKTKPLSLYDRVIETNTLRCAYLVWPPFMVKDPNTGAFSGMNYEFVMEIAKSLDLKIEWSVEINPGDQVEVLRSGRADAICTADGPFQPSTYKFLHYTEPLLYVPLYVYGRVNETRFQSPEDLNQKNVSFSVIDGDLVDIAARSFFSKASIYPLQHLSAPGQMMLDVMSDKTDVIINDPFSMSLFEESHPNTVKKLFQEPVLTVPLTFSVLRTEGGLELVDLLSQATKNMKMFGTIKRIARNYNEEGDIIFERP